MMRLAGKTAIITGSARGIGQAFAAAYVTEGAQVVIADIVIGRAQATAAGLGANAFAVALDVTDQASIDTAVAQTVDHFGKVDILINNAALFTAAPIVEIERRDYDRIILDCPPGLTETSEQVLRAADIIVIPVIPSPLSQRAMGEVARYLVQRGGAHAPILPVYSMVDRRRSLHRAALESQTGWPAIPMASTVEQMTVRRKPLGAFAPNSPPAQAFSTLWTQVERQLSAR